jgi:hypothetical protein
MNISVRDRRKLCDVIELNKQQIYNLLLRVFYNYVALSATPLSIKTNAEIEELWCMQQVHYDIAEHTLSCNFVPVISPCNMYVLQMLRNKDAYSKLEDWKEVVICYNYYSNKMHTFFIIKSQGITIRNFVLYFCPYMFQPAWVIFRGLNASAWLKLLLITIY